MSVARWAVGAMALITLSQLAIFLAVSRVATKALEEAKAGAGGGGSTETRQAPGVATGDSSGSAEASPHDALQHLGAMVEAHEALLQDRAASAVPSDIGQSTSAPGQHQAQLAATGHLPQFRLKRRPPIALPPLLLPLDAPTAPASKQRADVAVADGAEQPSGDLQPPVGSSKPPTPHVTIALPQALPTPVPTKAPAPAATTQPKQATRMPRRQPPVASVQPVKASLSGNLTALLAVTWGAEKPVDLVDTTHDIHAAAPVLSAEQKSLLVAAEVPQTLVHLKNAALLVLCYDRADYLTETLKAVEAAHLHSSIKKYISQDGDEFETAAVAQSFDTSFAYMTHPRTLPETMKQNTTDPELMVKPTPSTMFLAAHYKWALDKVFLEANHTHAIILEDDMKVTRDFFQFFEMLAPLLDADPTLWCVSSWNDNGFKHLDLSPRRMFRTSHFPGLGWLLRRELWLELRDAFPLDNWDHWMRATTTSKNRECVSPQLARNFNIGVGGATSNKFFYEQYLKTVRTFTGRDGVALGDLSYLLHDEYYTIVREMTSERGPSQVLRKKMQRRASRPALAGAPWANDVVAMLGGSGGAPTIVPAASASWKASSQSFAPGRTYVVPYVKEEYEQLATQLALHPTPRTHFRHTTWLTMNGANVFLVDKRRSPFALSSYRKLPHNSLRAVRAAKPGMSCTIVCENENSNARGRSSEASGEEQFVGWRCAPEQFDFVNDCLVLAKHFDGCPYGCTQGWGEDIPAMETWDIGHPPQCLTTEVSPTCDAEFAHTQRLCPCIAQHLASHHKSLMPVAARAANTNCDEVCAAYDGNTTEGAETSWRCDAEQFQFINTCQALKKSFGCAQCDTNFGSDLPNFVVNKKDSNYGKCLMMRGDMTCTGAHKNTKRLCPCVPAK